MRTLNRIRWQLARLFAPDRIIAAPSGDASAYILLRDGENGQWMTWIETSSINVEMGAHLRPLMGDELALSTSYGPKGTFSGTIGDKPGPFDDIEVRP